MLPWWGSWSLCKPSDAASLVSICALLRSEGQLHSHLGLKIESTWSTKGWTSPDTARELRLCLTAEPSLWGADKWNPDEVIFRDGLCGMVMSCSL